MPVRNSYTTVQGDMWDMIAKKLYGDEKQMHQLLAANPDYRETVIFSAGTVLSIPEIEVNEISQALPPWKQ